MSCVVRDIANRRHFSVVKGSPEMVSLEVLLSTLFSKFSTANFTL
jgi:hypothetical protein